MVEIQTPEMSNSMLIPMYGVLTFTTVWVNLADDKLIFISNFPQKIGKIVSC